MTPELQSDYADPASKQCDNNNQFLQSKSGFKKRFYQKKKKRGGINWEGGRDGGWRKARVEEKAVE